MYSDKASSATQLTDFLAALDLSKYLQTLETAEVNLELLDDLDDAGLKELFSEVKLPFGARSRLTRALENRKARTSQTGSSISSPTTAPSSDYGSYTDTPNTEEKQQEVVFNKYTSLEVLGSGNFGQAHLVSKSGGEKQVLKTLICEDLEAENRAQKEAVALAKLPSNPHLLAVKDFFFALNPEGAKVFCIVVNYCSGGEVEDLVKKGPSDVDIVHKVLKHVAEGLTCLHKAGLIHRDIKPDNLLFAEKDGDVVIGDMGLSCAVDPNTQYYQGTFGHQLYKAPEVVLKRRFSPAADMWALGAVALDLLSGTTMTARSKADGFILTGLNDTELCALVDKHVPQPRGKLVGEVVKGLLVTDDKKRLTATQVLEQLSEQFEANETDQGGRGAADTTPRVLDKVPIAPVQEQQQQQQQKQTESWRDKLYTMSAKQLRDELTARGLPTHDLVEKSDFVDRLLTDAEEEQQEQHGAINSFDSNQISVSSSDSGFLVTKVGATHPHAYPAIFSKVMAPDTGVYRWTWALKKTRSGILALGVSTADADPSKPSLRFSNLGAGYECWSGLFYDLGSRQIAKRGLPKSAQGDKLTFELNTSTGCLSLVKFGHPIAILSTSLKGYTLFAHCELEKSGEEVEFLGMVRLLKPSVAEEKTDGSSSLARDAKKAAENKGQKLFDSSASGNFEVVKGIVTTSPEFIDWQNTNGVTALATASFEGHISIVQFLIDKGADVNLAAKDGRTPLLMAIYKGHMDVVKVLLASNANKSATFDGKSLLRLAREQGRTQIINLLSGGEGLFEASVRGDLETVKSMVTIWPGLINWQNRNGVTPVATASFEGNLAIVKFLIEKGADINLRANDGRSPLLLAVYSGHKDIVKLLLANNASKSVICKGDNLLGWARKQGRPEIIQLLLNTEGTTACPNGHLLRPRSQQDFMRFNCDVCGLQSLHPSEVVGCPSCDFDCCLTCHKGNTA